VDRESGLEVKVGNFVLELRLKCSLISRKERSEASIQVGFELKARRLK
jgi:hypothetical protein